jgi:hypothetical protein
VAWLLKIAHTVCLTRWETARRCAVEVARDPHVLEDMFAATPVERDDLIPLPEALRQLNENQRRAILMREWQGLSYREIGEELQLSQAAVETLIFRARRALAQGLRGEPKTSARMRALNVCSALVTFRHVLSGTAPLKVAATMAVVGATLSSGGALERRDERPGSVVPAIARHDLAAKHAPSQLPPRTSSEASLPARASGPDLVRIGRATPLVAPHTVAGPPAPASANESSLTARVPSEPRASDPGGGAHRELSPTRPDALADPKNTLDRPADRSNGQLAGREGLATGELTDPGSPAEGGNLTTGPVSGPPPREAPPREAPSHGTGVVAPPSSVEAPNLLGAPGLPQPPSAPGPPLAGV